jgi:hypothetical protein
MSEEEFRVKDCDCVPGHRCDCWDFRAADGTVGFEPGHFHQLLGEQLRVDALARAIHATKGGGPFGVEGDCECQSDAAVLAGEYVRQAAKDPE